MAKFYNPIDSFKQAEAEYNNTRPVAVKNPIDSTKTHSLSQWLLQWDVRPISCRSRKQERTVKISKNHYALVDGDTTFLGWRADYTYTKDEFLTVCKKMAPINWYRNRKGEEFMEVRNTVDTLYTCGSVGRNDFINRHSPRSMYLHCKGGKQYFSGYYLPKRKFAPKVILDKFTAREASHWLTEAARRLGSKGDYKLTYKRETGGLTLISEPFAVPKKVVDKQAKQKHKKILSFFRLQACSLVMMMGRKVRIPEDQEKELDGFLADALGQSTDSKYTWVRKYSDVLKDPTSWRMQSIKNMGVTKEQIRSVVLDMMQPEHKFNYALILSFGMYCNGCQYPDKVLGNFNRWVNTVCGFHKYIKVDHT